MTSRQPAWNLHEAVILLEAYLSVDRRLLRRADAVKKVSADLRKMALYQGREIDETYRNESGIRFQMLSMESAVCETTTLKPSTKLFMEAVRIYREEPSVYQEILREAKRMIGEKHMIADDFRQYLAEKVSPSQLSELYPCYAEIEAFCKKLKILQKPLLETTEFEIIKKVYRTIEQNKIFRITHKRQHNKMVAACRHYYLYIREGHFPRQEEITDEKENTQETSIQVPSQPLAAEAGAVSNPEISLQEKYPIIHKRLYSVLEASTTTLPIEVLWKKIGGIARPSLIREILHQVSWAKSQGDEYAFCTEPTAGVAEKSQNQSAVFSVDFESDSDLSNTKPLSLGYFGEEITVGNTWSDLFVALVSALYEDYPHLLKPGLSFSANNTQVDWAINTDCGSMVAPRPVSGTDFVLETTGSANEIISKIKRLLELCCVDFENVVIQYEKEISATQNADASTLYRSEEYEQVLREHFQKGFRMNSPLEIKKFRRCYSLVFQKELSDSDKEISEKIQKLSILYDGKAFLPDGMLDETTKEELFAYIDSAFAEGKAAIYYQAIYTEFADAFLDHHIHDAEMLKAYLEATANGKFYIHNSFISKEQNVTVDPFAEIRNCLIEYGRPVTYEELFEALPHIPQSKIKTILGSYEEFVNNGQGIYFHEQILRLSEEELEGIANILEETINEKDFMGGNELYDAIEARYSYIIEENNALSVYGFRDALKAKLGDRFSFKGNIISHSGAELSMADVFAKYAQTHDSFTLSELQGLAANLATGVYYGAVYENSLRISQQQFVSKKMAQFAVTETDEVLDRICTGQYLPVCEVQNFGIFPYGGFPWNRYLLEHYVASYSKKYKLLHNGFTGMECAGAIVRRTANIDSFDDLLVDVLATQPVELQKQPALEYLTEKGYLARRRYTAIDSILIKAKAQKQRKDD